MMKEEFEKLAGYEVSTDDYFDIIEPMYLAVELDKKEFVATLNKKRFALPTKDVLVAQMRKLAQNLRQTCTHYTDYATREEFDQLVEKYQERYDSSAYVEEKMIQTCYYPSCITSTHTNKVIKLA